MIDINFNNSSDLVSTIDGITGLLRIIANEQTTECKTRSYLLDNALTLLADITTNISDHISDNEITIDKAITDNRQKEKDH